jgi:hypothetical protein
MRKPSEKKSEIAKNKPRTPNGRFVKKNQMYVGSSDNSSLFKTHIEGNPWLSSPADEFQRSVPPGITPMAPGVYHANIFRMISQSPSQIYRNLDEALRACKQSAKVMMNDGAITAPLFQRILHLVSCNDGLVPEDENDIEQVEMCEKLWDIVQKTPDWNEFKRTLAMALWYGKCANVSNFRWEYDNGERQMVVHDWTNIIGDKLIFRTNGRMGFICHVPSGFRDCVVTDIGRAELFNTDDYECITHHKYFIVDEPYDEGMLAIGNEGYGYRNYLYWIWWLKQMVLEWAMLGLQLYGNGGLRIGYFEESNPESAEAVAKALAEANGQNIILFPRPIGTGTGSERQGAGLEIISPSGLGLEWFQNFLDGYFGAQINQLILGTDWSTQRRDFHSYLKYDARKLEDTITRDFVSVLQKYNFPGYPHKIKYQIQVPHYNPEQIMTAAQRLYEMGGEVGLSEVASLVGLTLPGTKKKKLVKMELANQSIKSPRINLQGFEGAMSGGTGQEETIHQEAAGEANEGIQETPAEGTQGPQATTM